MFGNLKDVMKQTAEQAKAADPRFPINGNTGKRVENPVPQDGGEQITSGSLLNRIDGGHVEFGSYPQAADGGVKKILWRVLENKDGKLLLLSEYVLDARFWHTDTNDIPATGKKEDIERARIPWENTGIRRWLNGWFYDRAFHAAEKALIVERLNSGNGAYLHKDYVPKKKHRQNLNILADDTYQTYEERNCADTKDKVFFLSIEEALAYFEKGCTPPGVKWWVNYDRLAKPTAFLLKRGVIHPQNGYWYPVTAGEGSTWFGNELKVVDERLAGGIDYYLRSVGSNDAAMHGAGFHTGQLSLVKAIGQINAAGVTPDVMNVGVRPAILVNDTQL